MGKVPVPAVVGLNVPLVVLVIPVPDQVPPGVTEDKFVGGSSLQKISGVKVASKPATTVTGEVVL